MSHFVVMVDGSERPLEFAKLVRSVVELSLGRAADIVRARGSLVTIALFGNDHPQAARRLRTILDCAERTCTSLRIFELSGEEQLDRPPPASCEVTASYLLNVLDRTEGEFA